MLYLIFLLAAIIFGVSLFKKVKSVEEILLGSMLGIFIASFLTLAIYYFSALNSNIIIAVSVLFIFLIFLIKPKFEIDISKKINWREIFFLLLIIFLFLYFEHTHVLPGGDAGAYSAGYTWGDIAYHLTLMNSFAYTHSFQSPIFAGQNIHYSFMPDFLSAILKIGGASDRSALLIPNLIFGIILIVAFYLLAKEVTKSKKAAAIALLLLIFSGGFGFYYWLKSPNLSFNWSMPDYTHMPSKEIEFSNIFTSLLLPARTSLFGFAAFFAVILILLKEKNRIAYTLAGATSGLSFLFHPFSLGAIIIVSFFYVAVKNNTSEKASNKSELYKKIKNSLAKSFDNIRKDNYLYFFGALILFAVPQIILIRLLMGNVGSFIKISLGWVANKSIVGWVIFWILNGGVVLLLAPFATIEKWKEYIGYLVLFLLANILIFQPFAWDNIKILAIWWAGTIIFVSGFLSKLLNKNNIWKIVAILLIFISVFSGLLVVMRELGVNEKLYSAEDLKFASYIKNNTNPDALFLIYPVRHNDPISNLAGRHLLMGYEGWVWTRGWDYTKRKREIKEVIRGDGKQIICNYGINYLEIGRNRMSEVNKTFLNSVELIKSTNRYLLYKIPSEYCK